MSLLIDTGLLWLFYLLRSLLGRWLRIIDDTLNLFDQALSINFRVRKDRKLVRGQRYLFQCIFQAKLIIKFISLSVNNLVEEDLYYLSTITFIG